MYIYLLTLPSLVVLIRLVLQANLTRILQTRSYDEMIPLLFVKMTLPIGLGGLLHHKRPRKFKMSFPLWTSRSKRLRVLMMIYRYSCLDSQVS